MSLLTRRRLLSLVGLGGLTAVAARFALPAYWRVGPVRPVEGEAQDFVLRCFEGLDRAAIVDTHVHLVGMGEGDTGAWSNPDWRDPWNPWQRFQYELYLGASGIEAGPTADADYLARLLALHRQGRGSGKLLLFAFDWRHNEAGAVQRELSAFHTPNEWVLEVARANPDVLACASVHPYRADALEQLDAVAEAGARAIKWLPGAMGIDPASPRCLPYYERLVERGLVLITHPGEERSVEVHGDPDLGNPLRLRPALDLGVRVVMAHCASLGSNADLDSGENDPPQVSSFDLFMRMMEEERYADRLFGDVSAMNFINRCGEPLRRVLPAPHLHPRLLYASDYPLPALEPLHSTRFLQYRGYLTAEERRLCNEVIDANPLLGDFVVKRCLKVEEDGVVHRFAPRVFESGWLFPS